MNIHKESDNLTAIVGLIGTDKQGKGTTWRHTLYGLAKMGYDVLGVTFPMYNTVGGFGAEINLSHKQIIKILPELGVDTKGWEKSKWGQVYSYPLDRGFAIKAITDHIDKGGVVVTKRSSKATHAAYQKAFNNVDEETTMGLEPFIPDPMVIMNMLPKGLRNSGFTDKGSAVLDDFESQDQDPVAQIQNKYTEHPELVGAKYGFHIPYYESPERLKTVLLNLDQIFHNEQFYEVPREDITPIKILGTEEPKWDLRTKEGLEHFVNNFTGADLLESWFSHPIKEHTTYESLFTTNGKLESYPMSVKDEIEKVIYDINN